MRRLEPRFLFPHALELPGAADLGTHRPLTLDARTRLEVELPLSRPSGAELSPREIERLERYLEDSSFADLHVLFGSVTAAREKVLQAEHDAKMTEPGGLVVSGSRALGKVALLMFALSTTLGPILWPLLGVAMLDEGLKEARRAGPAQKLKGFVRGALELRYFKELLGAVFHKNPAKKEHLASARVAERELHEKIREAQGKLLAIAQRPVEE